MQIRASSSSSEEVDKKLGPVTRGPPKMGTLATCFAVMKAYCAINVLLLPCSFANGGYVLSPIAMLVAVSFESLCAARLTTVA